MPKLNEYPTYENCDQDNPKDWMVWALMAFPWLGDVPMPIDPMSWEDICQYMWDLGFRHHPELQVKKIIPPTRGPKHYTNQSARIVEMDHEQKPIILPDPSEQTEEEQEMYIARLRETGALAAEQEIVDKASVSTHTDFEPANESVAFVNGYLHAADDKERSRVLALEMTGKKRKGILKNPKWRGL